MVDPDETLTRLQGLDDAALLEVVLAVTHGRPPWLRCTLRRRCSRPPGATPPTSHRTRRVPLRPRTFRRPR